MKNPQKSVTRSVVLPREIDSELVRLAAQEDRTISYMIARAVREYTERSKSPDAPKKK